MDKCRPISPQRRPGMFFMCPESVSLTDGIFLVSRRFSRSPSRRRPYSPLAPYRGRPRSRSRHSSPKRFRPGNYSRVASPHSRSCSPYRQRPSRDRSRSRSHNSKIKSRAASLDTIKVEPSDPLPNSMVEDCKQLSKLHIAENDVKAPLNPPQDTSTLNQPIGRSYKSSPSQDDIKPEIRMASPVPQTSETLPAEDRKITETTESIGHKPSPQSPMLIQAQSPSPPRLPINVPESTARVLPTGPQRNWPSRSPPRGPRSHPRNPMPMPPSSAPRAPRRGFPPTGPASSFSGPAPNTSRHNLDSKKNTKTLDPDLDVRSLTFFCHCLGHYSHAQIYRAQANRSHLASDHLQRAKNLRRALHELDLATIDLRAAEIRRHIADVQLEKARNGALGIDADAPSANTT